MSVGDTFQGRDTSTFVDGDIVYVAHRDVASGKLAVRKLESGVWSAVGPATISISNAWETSIYVDNGVPYIAYDDGFINTRGLTVMRYDADADDWVIVGNRGISGSANISEITLAIDRGEIYVSYQIFIASTQYEAYVKKYDADTDAWVDLGGDRPLDRSYTTIGLGMLAKDGVVYVSRYRSLSGNSYIHVDKFDDTTPDSEWEPVTAYAPEWIVSGGSSNFGNDVHQGRLYNAHVDFYGQTYVKQAGANWQSVGTLGNRIMYGYEYASKPVIRWYAGIMYVAYSSNVEETIRIAVDRFDGMEWTTLGDPIVAPDEDTYFDDLSLHVDQGKLTLSMLEVKKGVFNGDYKLYTYQDDIALDIPPAIAADPRERGSSDEIVLTFEDDPLWRERLVRILAGSRTLYEHQDYELGEGSITIHPNVLEAGFQTISVQAEGYSGATVIQTVRPGAPGTVSIESVGDSYAQVSWSAVAGADAYTIYYAKSPNPRQAADAGSMTVTASLLELKVVVPDLDNGDTYYFAVTSRSDGLESGASAEVQATPRLITDEANRPWELLGASLDGLNPSLFLHEGTPYVAYRDGGAISAMIYEGGEWQPIGDRNFSIGDAFEPVITVDQGIPYVVFTTRANEAVVMKFAGGAWTEVGTEPVSTDAAGRYSLLVHEGVPHVAYMERIDGVLDGSRGIMQIKRLITEGEHAGQWESVGDLSGYAEVLGDSLMLRQGGDSMWLTFLEVGASEVRLQQWDLTADEPEWQTVELPEELLHSLADALVLDGERLYYAYHRIGAGAERIMEVWSYDRLAEQWSSLGGHIVDYEVAMHADQGIPYVAYVDPASHEHRVIVKKYVNGDWYSIGSRVYPRGTTIRNLGLAVQDYQPYVTYYTNIYAVEVRSLLYEHWCAVTFDPRVAGSAPWTVNLPCGEPLPEPRLAIEKPNYRFVHWASDDDQPFDFTLRIESPVQLHAVWKLGVPLNVTIDQYGDGQLTLQWEAVPGATGYRIYRSADAELVGEEVGESSDNRYVDEGLVNGVTYYYVVTATDGAAESEYSALASGVPRTQPDAPQTVTARAVGGTATLRFDKPDDGGSALTGYRAMVMPDADSGLDSYEYEDVLVPDSLGADPVELTLDGLQIGIGYTFSVAALNAEGASGWSAPTERVVPYYACSYLLYGKDGTPAAQMSQPCLDPIAEPSPRQGFAFGGWFRDESFTVPFVESDANRDAATALYAKWTRTSEPLPVDAWHLIDQLVDRKFHLDAITVDGELVEAYWDAGYLSVRRYRGEAWEQAGNRRFAAIANDYNPSSSQRASLFAERGTVYVAFNDDAHNLRLMKLAPHDDAWSDVSGLANVNFAGTMLASLELVVADGTPYAAYTEYSELHIKQWDQDAGLWVDAGDGLPLADISVGYMSLDAVGSKLYIAYTYYDFVNFEISVAASSLDAAEPHAQWLPAGDFDQFPVLDAGSYFEGLDLLVHDGNPLLTLVIAHLDATSVIAMRLEHGEWSMAAERNWEETPESAYILDRVSVAAGSKTPYLLYSVQEWDKVAETSARVIAADRLHANPHRVGDSMQPSDIRPFAMKLLQAGDRLYALYASAQLDYETFDITYQSVVQEMTLASCKVHFVTDDGSGGLQEDVLCGEPVEEPAEPHRTGYAFAGWYEDEARTQAYSFSRAVIADLTLYAKWLPAIPDAPANTAVLGTGDGYVQIGWSPVSRAASYNVYVGTTSGLPGELAATVTDTVYAGTGLSNGVTYYFSVTAVNESGESEYGEQVSAMPDRAVCAVSFDTRGGSAVATSFVPCGDAVDRPSESPTFAGYAFAGWYADAEAIVLYDFHSPVNANLTLYAGWTRELPGGAPEHLAVQEVGDGYVRIGWSAVPEAKGYNVYVSTTDSVYGSGPVTVTDTVYAATGLLNGTRYYFAVSAMNESGESASSPFVSAVPGIPACTVFFDSRGGSMTEPQVVPCGDRAAMPSPDPARAGYRFTGWFLQADGTHPYDFGTVVTADLTLYAGWEAVPPAGGGDDSGPGTPPVDGGSSGGGGDGPADVDEMPNHEPRVVEIWVNGIREHAGLLKVTEIEGSTVAAMSIALHKLEALVAAEAGEGTLTLPFVEPADAVVGILTGEQVKWLERHGMKVEIQTEGWRYEIDAALIEVDRLIAELGGDIRPEDLEIRVEIAWSPAAVKRLAENAAEAQESAILAAPVRFSMKGIHKSRETEAVAFDRMVTRAVRLPDGIDPAMVTTAAVIEPDGSLRHVPTRILRIDGHYYASISSLTNSDYVLIAKAARFEDVARHWSRDIVHDLGARLILQGYGDNRFRPDQQVTRGEFVSMLVRTLGLQTAPADPAFADVHGGAIHAAYARGLVRGYADGNFRPSERITRQEAMVLVARAMELTHARSMLPAASHDAANRLAPFDDREAVASWAVESVAMVVESGIVSGRSGRLLEAEARITRAEAAAMLHRLLQTAELIDG